MTDNGGAARRTGRRWLWIIAGLAGAGAVAAVVAIWHLPARMYPAADQADARASLQGGLLTAAAALTAVAGALIALDETRQANAETKRSNEAADGRERSANANTHVREFYVAAIGLLSSGTVDGRLGGLYALERLATDSPDDQRTVIEVLSAFVREHAHPPAPDPAGTPPPPAPTTPATDVQTALTILGRLPVRAGVPRIDLTGANLTGADLGGADLTRARLNGANLTGADLGGADLTRARLIGADLTGAHLVGADLIDAELLAANLTRAGLVDADLTDAQMVRANLTSARLVRANLTSANLGAANLTDAALGGANLTDAKLHRADLTGAEGLVQGQVDVAFGNAETRLPVGLVRPTSW